MSAKFVYNKDLSVVDSGDQDALAFIQAVQTIIGSIVKVSYEPPVYKIFPTKLYRDMTSAIKTMYSFGNKYAEELQSKRPKAEDAKGLLEQWLTEGKVSKEHAVILSIDMFGAGVDTVSAVHHIISQMELAGCYFILYAKRFTADFKHSYLHAV